jgi:hypothetical protein
MGAPQPFDARPILRVLATHNVDFVLIGALATIFHGSPVRTGDADITPAADRGNLERLAAALAELDARIRVAGEREGLAFDRSAEALSRAQIWNLITPHGDLDISFVPSGTAGYDDLIRDAVTYEIAGVHVKVASLADVIRSKEAADRPKDRAVLPTLRELLVTIEGRRSGQGR